jgi:hypothetical protein
LSKYDVTGVGLNIGEVENRKGETKLAVLGIVLGSPAQTLGVRQVCLKYTENLLLAFEMLVTWM